MISAFLLMQTILATDSYQPESSRIILSSSTLTTTQGGTAPRNTNSTRPPTPTGENNSQSGNTHTALQSVVEMHDVLPAAGAAGAEGSAAAPPQPSATPRNVGLGIAGTAATALLGVYIAHLAGAKFNGYSREDVMTPEILVLVPAFLTAATQQVRLWWWSYHHGQSTASASTANEPTAA